MATSKLFNPQIRAKRGNALDRAEVDDMFINVPVHAEVPRFTGPTDSGKPCHPLHLTQTSQQNLGKPERRWVSSAPQEDTKY